jgi:HK97 family phage major capsid protein
MTTTATEPERGAEELKTLPILWRDFEVLEITLKTERRKKKNHKKKGATGKDDPAGEGKSKDNLAPDATRQAEEDSDLEDDPDDEEFEIAISSEYPVQRWYGKEILSHDPAAVDLSRAKRGISFLTEHNARDLVGIVNNVRLDDDKKLRGDVRFSRNNPAQEVKTDILDGIRRFISVGYMVSEYVLEKSLQEEGDTYRATKWTPVESSSVAVPADPTVGHNRSAGEKEYPVSIIRRSAAENPTASKPNTEVTVTTTAVVVSAEESRKAAAEIFRLGQVHGIDHARVMEMVEKNYTIDQASSEILSLVAKRGAKPLSQPPAEAGPERLELTDREQNEYNIARGIMAMVANRQQSDSGSAKRVNCLELEISQEVEKRWNGANHGGMFVPWTIRHTVTKEIMERYHVTFPGKRATGDLDTKTTGKGAELVFTMPGEFIEFLYNRMRLKELGARTISGLRDNVAYPKQTGRATGNWVGENPGTDIANTALTLAQVFSSPKTYQSSTRYSRQLLAQAVIDVDTLVREDLAMDMALAVDFAGIAGDPAAAGPPPTGITKTTGVQIYRTVGQTANGDTLAWDDVIIMSEKLEDVNADQLGEGAWLTTPGVKSRLKRTARLGNVVGLPIWEDDDTVDGYEGRSTNQVPKNGTLGTGTNLHTLIRGIFETMVIGFWGSGFELVVDPYLYKKQGMIELTTFLLADVALKYPQAFIVAPYIIP